MKPREWYVYGRLLDQATGDPTTYEEQKRVRVVEYSAYEAVLAERDRYKQMWHELATKLSHPVEVPLDR